MKEEVFRPIVKQTLNDFGLEVFDIPPDQNERRPDFTAIGEKDKYLIELKIKDDDPEEIEQENAALLKGKLVTKSISVGPRNRLRGIIKDGVNQMLAYDPTDKNYRILWLHSSGQDPELHNKRFRSTLFGNEYMFSLDLPNLLNCFYFHDSAFFSCRNDLDGAILSDKSTIQLCINSLSPRADVFRKSDLVAKMSAGLCDPQKIEESNEDVLIADCDIDRKMPDKVIAYLQKKYGFGHLQVIEMQQHTGKIALPKNEIE